MLFFHLIPSYLRLGYLCYTCVGVYIIFENLLLGVWREQYLLFSRMERESGDIGAGRRDDREI